jgi:tetratricopeptide (TPR) repeat protein
MKRVSSPPKRVGKSSAKKKPPPAKAKKSKPGKAKKETKKLTKKLTKRRSAALSKRRRVTAKHAAKHATKHAVKPVPAPVIVVEKPVITPAVRGFEQAIKLFNRQDFARAREAFETVIERFPLDADIAARARAYITICQQRLAHPPSLPRSSEALYDRGIIELNRGQFTMAMTYFERALKLEPEADHVVYALASVYAQTGELEKAMAALKRSIELNEGYRLQARRDPDFRSLYVSEDFQRLVGLEIME